MTAPSGYLRTLRETQASRRLGVAKILRENPDATNIELAKIFAVDRDTIAEDRKALMQQLTKNTTSEMESLREELRQKLEKLEEEVELHRKDGKLSLGAIDQLLSINKAVIELLGARKPVKEELDVNNKGQMIVKFTQVIHGEVVRPQVGGTPILELTEGQNANKDGRT